MALLFLAFLGGILTILSPCILPVLPFVFARADQPFRRRGLPLLTGMALTFAPFAALATIGGNWVVRTNQYGRALSMALLTLFGLALLWPALAERFSRPFVRLGGRMAQPSGSDTSPLRSLLLGISIGLLWAPCAGPILGLILTGAAIQGVSGHSALLLLAYAAGAATSLAVALFAGGRLFAILRRSLGAEVWIRRALGVAVLAGVAAIALGLDRGLLTQISLASTGGVEQSLLDRFQPKKENAPAVMPDLPAGAVWLNSPPLTRAELKGHVVLIDFWTYSCINCLRTIPYIRAWADKYRDSGLIVIGAAHAGIRDSRKTRQTFGAP